MITSPTRCTECGRTIRAETMGNLVVWLHVARYVSDHVATPDTDNPHNPKGNTRNG